MDINLELYKVFYYIVKTGNVTKAAESLFISQSAVSQSLKKLETKIGCSLFARNNKKLVITKEGELLYGYIEKAYNFIEAGQRRVYESLNLISGNLRIGASDTICKYLLAKPLEQFHNLYPNIKIQITNRTSSETLSLLNSGKVDIGFVSISDKHDYSITLSPIIKIEDCFVAGKKYNDIQNKTTSISELENMPILMLEKISQSRRFVDKYFESLGNKISPEIELGSLDLLVLFAKIGLGISCVVKNFVIDELDGKNLFEVKLKEKIPPRYIYLAKHNNFSESKITKSFVELIDNS